MSHPVRGAWIEINTITYSLINSEMSHPVRGAWIEITICLVYWILFKSRIP